MVALAIGDSLSHSPWSQPLVDRSHLHSSIRFAGLDNNATSP